MNDIIVNFLQKQTCASVCCLDNAGKPRCFSCFYVFNPSNQVIYYKSASDTHHSARLKNNPFVSGTILPDKLNTLMIKGVQFEGTVVAQHDRAATNAHAQYYKKYPMAIAVPGEIWTIQLHHIKMTDSSLGFGKKIRWAREEQAV